MRTLLLSKPRGPILARSTDGTLAHVDLDTGRVWPYVAGADEGEPSNPPQPAPLTATQQALVDAAIGQARAEARQSGRTEAHSEFTTWLSHEADQAGANGTEELTRIRGERDTARTDLAAAQQATATAQSERDTVTLDAFAMIALLGEDMPHTNLTDGLRLLEHKPGDDLTALATKAAALKTRLPALFVAEAGTAPPPGGAPPPPGGAPRPPAVKGGPRKSMAELGQETLRKAGIRPRQTAA